jgi:hypothetical protein
MTLGEGLGSWVAQLPASAAILRNAGVAVGDILPPLCFGLGLAPLAVSGRPSH